MRQEKWKLNDKKYLDHLRQKKKDKKGPEKRLGKF
jgi:hypothetical protein